MKITYLLCISSYVLFCIRNRNSRNILAEFLLFSVIAAPGISIDGRLINIVDFLLPCLFVYLFFVNGKRMQLSALEGAYFLYALIALFSLLVNFGTYSSVVVALLQVIRLFYIPVGVLIFKTHCNFKDKNQAINSINVYGIWLGIITIVAFFEQGTIYDSIQSMWFNGMEVQRAAGVFGESSYLGVISLILFVSGVFSLRNSDQSSYKRNGVIGIIFSVICNILSYTRITNIALIFLLLAFILTMRSFAKKVFILSVALIVVIISAAASDFVRSFIVDRMGSVFGIFEDFNGASSGRLEVWREAYERYLQGSIFFGSGYKNGFFGDNNFIMSLTQMGILGIFSHVVLIVALCMQSWNKRGNAAWSLLFILLICSMTCDVLTYYRPMCLMMIIYYLLNAKTSKLKLHPQAAGMRI